MDLGDGDFQTQLMRLDVSFVIVPDILRRESASRVLIKQGEWINPHFLEPLRVSFTVNSKETSIIDDSHQCGLINVERRLARRQPEFELLTRFQNMNWLACFKSVV